MATEETTQGNQLGDFEKAVLGDQFVEDEAPKEEASEKQEEAAPEKVEEETPKEEVKEEAPKEEPKPEEQPKAEEQPVEEQPKETSFEINDFNQRFKTEFTDEESLSKALADSQKIAELEKLQGELDTVKEENLLLKENLDPMKYFATEDDYKIAQFKKQFPDKDAAVAYQLFSADLSKMEPLDIIAYEMMLDNPGLEKETVMELMKDTYDIEDGEELDKVSKAKITVAANKATKSINSLKGQITLPDKVDVDSLSAEQKELQTQKKQQRTDAWKGIATEASKTLPDIVVKDDKGEELFKYSIGNDFPQDITESVVQMLSEGNVEPSREVASTAIEYMKQQYLSRNFDKIIKAAMDDVRSKAEEERLKKQHNPGSAKAEEKPKDADAVDPSTEFEKRIGGFQPTPLFK